MWTSLARLARHRTLIQSLVARELTARYRGSVLGFFWSFVNPLLLLAIYAVVFQVLLPNRAVEPYALFLFCGILPWTWFSASLLESSGSLVAGGNLIKRVLFPAEVLPIVSVLANMVHFFFGFLVLAAFLAGFRHAPDWAGLPWLPVVVAIQLVFTIGLALLLSALTVHFRDVRDLLANFLTLGFWATPIVYPWTMEGIGDQAWFRWVLGLNPLAHLVIAYQELLFFDGPVTHAPWLALTGAVSIVVLLAGYWVFDRLRDSFAEVV
jgi:ABC-type polysaccharide/polyol phosphate export permease